MKLAILSRNLVCYSTRRLREAAEQRGHKVKVLDTLKFAIDLQKGEPDLYFLQHRRFHYRPDRALDFRSGYRFVFCPFFKTRGSICF